MIYIINRLDGDELLEDETFLRHPLPRLIDFQGTISSSHGGGLVIPSSAVNPPPPWQRHWRIIPLLSSYQDQQSQQPILGLFLVFDKSLRPFKQPGQREEWTTMVDAEVEGVW